MKTKIKKWVGVDPGGKGHFGVAIIIGKEVQTFCVDHADEAIEVIFKAGSEPPFGIGVDAPLWWSSGKSSDRETVLLCPERQMGCQARKRKQQTLFEIVEQIVCAKGDQFRKDQKQLWQQGKLM
jgi:predicted nuclease with RNAse H fold